MAIDIHRPCLLFRKFRQVERICRCAFLVDLAATGVHGRFAIRRQPHARDQLPVVAFVIGHLMRHEIRGICNPDVARAFVVEDPGDTRRMRRTR